MNDSDRFELEVMAELWDWEEYDALYAKWCEEVNAKINALTEETK